jgi:hypothetical protein
VGISHRGSGQEKLEAENTKLKTRGPRPGENTKFQLSVFSFQLFYSQDLDLWYGSFG